MTKIGFGDDDMAAVGGDLEFFHLAAKQPGPQRVGQFVAEDVNPHRLGQQQKITTQHAAPASSGIQTVSAPPLARRTRHSAMAAPAQTGSSRMAMMNLIHFGTRGRFATETQRTQRKIRLDFRAL